MLFSFELTLIYMVLLYVRIGQHKLQRSENIFVIYAWGGRCDCYFNWIYSDST